MQQVWFPAAARMPETEELWVNSRGESKVGQVLTSAISTTTTGSQDFAADS